MKAGVHVKFNHLPQLKKKLKSLNKQTFQIGYWKEQGYHETKGEYESDPILYTDLMYILHNGSRARNIPPRPVLFNTVFMYNQPEKDRSFKKLLRNYFKVSELKAPKITASVLLDNAAGYYVKTMRGYYGNSGLLKSNHPITISQKQRNTPLLWSGDLRDNLSYKTSINGVLVTP